jgi:hypothetical protein
MLMHNHSICDPCWDKKFPNRVPVRGNFKLGALDIRGFVTASGTCCFCGKAHCSGIFSIERRWPAVGYSGPITREMLDGTQEQATLLTPCAFCGKGALQIEDGGTVLRCGNCGITTPGPVAAAIARVEEVDYCVFCDDGAVVTEGGVVCCDNFGASGPAGNMLSAPPKAAVSVSKADAPEPCTKCPEGVSPHAANYVLRWRDGSLQCERRVCSRVMPDMIEDVLLGNEIEP